MKTENLARNSRYELATILDLILDKQKLLSGLNSQIISELSEEEFEAEIIESDEYCLNLEMKIRKMRKFLQPAAQAATPSPLVPVTQSSLNPLAETFDINRNQTSSFNSQQMYRKLPKLSENQIIKRDILRRASNNLRSFRNVESRNCTKQNIFARFME